MNGNGEHPVEKRNRMNQELLQRGAKASLFEIGNFPDLIVQMEEERRFLCGWAEKQLEKEGIS